VQKRAVPRALCREGKKTASRSEPTRGICHAICLRGWTRSRKQTSRQKCGHNPHNAQKVLTASVKRRKLVVLTHSQKAGRLFASLNFDYFAQPCAYANRTTVTSCSTQERRVMGVNTENSIGESCSEPPHTNRAICSKLVPRAINHPAEFVCRALATDPVKSTPQSLYVVRSRRIP